MYVKKGKLLALIAIIWAAISLAPSAQAARGVSMGHATVHVSSSSGSHSHYGRGWGGGRGWGRGWGGGYEDYPNPYAWGSGAYQTGMTENSLDIYNREHDAQTAQMPAAACIRTYTWPTSNPYGQANPYSYSSISPTAATKTCQINPASKTKVASNSPF